MNQTNQIPQAQRSLKHFHAKGVLFAAEDLICQGIDLVHNTSLQQYVPACIKADIIEDLKKRKNVLVEPTGVNLSKDSLNPSSSSMYALSKTRISKSSAI